MEKVTPRTIRNKRLHADDRRSSSRDRAARRRARLRGLIVYLLFVSVGCSGVFAENQRPTESQVEAAYLFNFGKFVDYPPSVEEKKTEPFVICVLGDDPFGSALDGLLAKGTVKGKGLSARRIVRLQDASVCHVLFISSSEASRVGKIIATLGNTSVLTVSDMPQFVEHGGMIQFVLEGGKVRFEVNLTAAESAGLALSSELLKVAVNVRRIPPQS